MQINSVCTLGAQRTRIRSRWEDLLRVERANSPLANPDTLVHLIDVTLDELLTALDTGAARRRHGRLDEASCPCGRNPLLIYFAAGRQAIREALVLAQAGVPNLTREERDAGLAILESTFGQIARREIEAFCAVCQFRETPAAPCRSSVASKS